MLANLFPTDLYNAIKKAPIEKITEIRLRLDKKIIVSIGNKSYYLSPIGLTGNIEKALTVEKYLIDEIFNRACENSVYAYSYQIRSGYITIFGGIRIGLTGEAVYEKNKLKSFKNISSLAIRIPHEVKGCSLPILPILFKENFLNTLIVSPPGAGKTTMIRDIVYQMSKMGYCYNILIVDERFEIANCFNGKQTLDVGNFSDVLSGVTKNYAFENGIRSLKPDIIVTDEIANLNDYESILYAAGCGVNILASVHAKKIEDLIIKKDFEILLKNKVFSRIIILSQKDGPGKIEAIYDENLRLLSV